MDIKWIISKLLGYSIVSLSFIFKLPQIISMYKDKMIKGLSELSLMSEILVYSNTALYSYHLKMPFSTWGENLIIVTQCIIILLLFYLYSNWSNISIIHKLQRLLLLPLLFAFVIVSVDGKLITEEHWSLIASSPLFFVSTSRISQIINSYRVKSTGPLNIVTFILGIMGNLARGYTIIIESGDLL